MRLSVIAFLLAGAASPVLAADPVPATILGTWTIARILPTTNTGCWTPDRAQPLVGTRLSYAPHSMVWTGGTVPVSEVVTRTLTNARFRKENPGNKGAATLAQLGIKADSVTELDLQHDDADITGASTEVPGDSILMVSPTRIVVSACGVYMEATRARAPVAAKGKPRRK